MSTGPKEEMILSCDTIKKLIKEGEIAIEPLDENQIQPASVDCRLADEFLLVKENEVGTISLSEKISYRLSNAKEFFVPPKSFVLARTVEYIKIPADISAFVEGRSSIGRMGLFIQNAGWVDPGFEGTITLELFNANSIPIKLISGRRICQLVFAMMDRKVSRVYDGKYQGQKRVTGSRIHLDEQKA